MLHRYLIDINPGVIASYNMIDIFVLIQWTEMTRKIIGTGHIGSC